MLAVTSVLLVVNCGGTTSHVASTVQIRPTTTTVDEAKVIRAFRHARDVRRLTFTVAYNQHLRDVWIYTTAARKNAETARAAERKRHMASQLPRAVSATPVGSVAQCIKNHESGNYSESSHLSSGSGAYQFIPSTWRTWSQRAGYGGYSYAYQAPPAVQDAVLNYTLNNGGAGNWSMRFGNDPCTGG